jgi:hypothetical protein
MLTVFVKHEITFENVIASLYSLYTGLEPWLLEAKAKKLLNHLIGKTFSISNQLLTDDQLEAFVKIKKQFNEDDREAFSPSQSLIDFKSTQKESQNDPIESAQINNETNQSSQIDEVHNNEEIESQDKTELQKLFELL